VLWEKSLLTEENGRYEREAVRKNLKWKNVVMIQKYSRLWGRGRRKLYIEGYSADTSREEKINSIF